MRRVWMIAAVLSLTAATVWADGDHPKAGMGTSKERDKPGKPKPGPNWSKSVEEACAEAKDRNCPIFVYWGMDN